MDSALVTTFVNLVKVVEKLGMVQNGVRDRVRGTDRIESRYSALCPDHDLTPYNPKRG